MRRPFRWIEVDWRPVIGGADLSTRITKVGTLALGMPGPSRGLS
jgi:hypothetical protein